MSRNTIALKRALVTVVTSAGIKNVPNVRVLQTELTLTVRLI